MKHTIEIPDDYEFDHVAYPILGKEGGAITVIVKKKQTKDFDYFVDQYLSASNATVDFITGWIPDRDIEVAKNRLKTKQFDLVCWEIKFGLFRFICDSFDLPWCPTAYHAEVNKEELKSIQFPKEFIDDLFKTKTN